MSGKLKSALAGALITTSSLAIASSAYGQVASVKNQLAGLQTLDISEAGGLGIEYGFAYDSRRQQFPGGACIRFSSEAIVSSTQAVRTETELVRTASLREVANRLKVGVEAFARYGTERNGARASMKSDIMKTAETNKYAQTLLAKVIHEGPEDFINLDSVDVGLQERYRDMIMTPGGAGEFKRDCGDSFVIGMQWGHQFYGIAQMEEMSRDYLSTQARQGEAEAAYAGAAAGVEVNRGEDFKEFTKNSSLSVKTWQTGSSFPASDFDSMITAFNRFASNQNQGGKGEKLKLFVTSYAVLNDFPVRDPLAPRTNEDKLGNMKDALWDLQSMIKEVELYLDPKNLGTDTTPALFAYGNPGYLNNGTDKVATQINLLKVKSHWQKEFDALREMMLLCIEDFDRECDAASELYKRTETRTGQRLREINSELRGMPPPYAAICRDQDFRITSDKLRDKFKAAIERRHPEAQGKYGSSNPILLATEAYDANPTSPGRQGDDETSGNPVMVRGWLNFLVDRAGETITAYLGANFTEFGSNYRTTNQTTELGASISATAFSTNASGMTPDVGPEFPSTCKIEKDYPFAGRGLSIALEHNPNRRRDRGSYYLGVTPPGAPGAFIPRASLSNDIKVTDRSYGYVEKLSAKNQHSNFTITQRDADGYRDRGVLRSLSCTPDTGGNDRHRGSGNSVDNGASCSDIDIQTLKINFYPREDDGSTQRNTRLNRLKPLEILDILKRKTAPLLILDMKPQFFPLPVPATPVPSTGGSTPSTPTPISSSGSDATSCVGTIQGKIAWDASGTKTTWNRNNINRLCGTATSSPEPGNCFNEIMRGGHDNGAGGTTWGWSKAVDLCAGTTSSANTVSCYAREVRTIGHDRAIQSCKL